MNAFVAPSPVARPPDHPNPGRRMTKRSRCQRELMRVIGRAVELARRRPVMAPCSGSRTRRVPIPAGDPNRDECRVLLRHVTDSNNPEIRLMGAKADQIQVWIDHVVGLPTESVRAVLERSR